MTTYVFFRAEKAKAELEKEITRANDLIAKRR